MQLRTPEDIRDYLRPAIQSGKHWSILTDDPTAARMVSNYVFMLLDLGIVAEEDLHIAQIEFVNVPTGHRAKIYLVTIPKDRVPLPVMCIFMLASGFPDAAAAITNERDIITLGGADTDPDTHRAFLASLESGDWVTPPVSPEAN